MEKRKWKSFKLNGKVLCSYTFNGTFDGEEEATLSLLAAENKCNVSDISITIEEDNKNDTIIKEERSSIMGHSVILHESKQGASRKVTVDNILYSSMNEMRWILGISETEIFKQQQNGYTKAEAIIICLCKKEEKRKEAILKQSIKKEQELKKQQLREEKMFFFRNKSYENFSSCCRYYSKKFGIDLNPNSIKTSTKKTNETIQEALDRFIQIKLQNKFTKKKSKYLYILFNTKEKAEKCANLLKKRCVEIGNFGTCTQKHYIKYKPL